MVKGGAGYLIGPGWGGIPNWYRAGRGTCLVQGRAGYLIGVERGGVPDWSWAG